MNFKKWYSYKRVWALLLTVSILTGCVRGGLLPDSVSETTMSAQDYEIYKKESFDAQKAFDGFCKDLFRDQATSSLLILHCTLSDPAAYGITDYPITYGDFSSNLMRQDFQDMKEEKDTLDSIDPNLLTNDQQITYQILAQSYETELSGKGMELYYQPLGPTIGIQDQLPIILSEYAFNSKQDVEDYLELLAQTDEYYTQILAFEKERADAGLSMGDDWFDSVISSCDKYTLTPERSFLSDSFTERLSQVPGLTAEETDAYTTRNLQILGSDFIPAYQLLADGLTALKGTGTNPGGLCGFPQGKEYYQYLVNSNTGTTYDSVDALCKAIEDQMNQDLVDMSKIIKEHPDVTQQLAGLSVIRQQPTQILSTLIQGIQKDFPALPECSYTVKYVPEALEGSLSPAFYLVPPIDNYQKNTIYINRGTPAANADLFPTLAHEGYPGHLYQNVYFLSSCKDDLRKILSFPSYSEGWAFYVENYSYSIDPSLDPNLALLLAHNSSCNLGLHAILDLYINYYGWSREQVAEYLSKYYNLNGTDIVNNLYSVMVASPTNYLKYYVGYLEILKMRNTAERTLKDSFNLKDFNTFLLDMGPAPFTVIEPYFNTWLMTYNITK